MITFLFTLNYVAMTIRFPEQEIEMMRNYFKKIASGETQKQSDGLQHDSPEWTTIFLLLRKLLAYGIHNNVATLQGTNYVALQSKTQKSRDMLVNVHAHLDEFENLLATYLVNRKDR
ncbi:hypothetical protein IC229_14900 [Spirosoma sp. BT702]|uniref:Uncharacterized protein n=1 Tax=Spirosoma profusum TaxID=2771354 RepID=A0A926XXF9_9BACT|nr:hypothetical protein [Spirosoma profusum]MBD2701935.1 hypothetical protein [Spirosoma profusum]